MCQDFPRYCGWIEKHFGHVTKKGGLYFIPYVLRITNEEDINSFATYTPQTWASLLDHKFEKYMQPLTEMIIIWIMTVQRYKPRKYTKYIQAREQMMHLIYEELQEAANFAKDCDKLKLHKAPSTYIEVDKKSPVNNISYQATRPRPVDTNGDPEDDPDDSSSESSSSKSSSKVSVHFPSWLPKKPRKDQDSHRSNKKDQSDRKDKPPT